MRKIHVNGRVEAQHDHASEWISRYYTEPTGLKLVEYHAMEEESDFSNGIWMRESPDNGRTWGEAKSINVSGFEKVGEKDEITYISFDANIYDPASGNFVTCGMFRYFVGNHTEALSRKWQSDEKSFYDHCYLVYRQPDGTIKKQLIDFEGAGTEYDPENPFDPAYMEKNLAYFSVIRFASNGDLLFPIAADLRYCCEALGLSTEDVFASCPNIWKGVLLVRAHWEPERGEYLLTYSKPVVISDVQSSRGILEPCVCELASGRIVIVFRGSNGVYPNWNSRINPCAPGFKWYIYSDDGGKTFTPAMPWYFDTREVVYSSSTISYFFKSSKTGKNYWIGNITDPTNTYENYPRFPLYICEVDDTYGYLLKDTLTLIDTRREGESEYIQLSNFSLFENRETGNLEVRLARIGQNYYPGQGPFTYDSESWVYEISFEEDNEG